MGSSKKPDPPPQPKLDFPEPEKRVDEATLQVRRTRRVRAARERGRASTLLTGAQGLPSRQGEKANREVVRQRVLRAKQEEGL